MQELPEARDDEQRIVHADTEPDHRDQDRCDRVDVGQAGQDEEQQEGREQRGDRQRDRDQHGHERPEDDEQHDDRRQQAEDLRQPLLDWRELGFAVVLDGHAHRLDRLADGVLDGEDGLAVLVLDRLAELRLGVGDAAVVGERVLAERVAHALQTGVLSDGLELLRLQARDRLLDRRLALLRVEPLAFRCGEDDVQHAALLGRELGLEQVDRPLRVRSRNLELVAQFAPDRADEDDQEDDDAEPAGDDAPRMRGAGPRPVRQGAGGEPFMGCPPCHARVPNVGPHPRIPVSAGLMLSHALVLPSQYGFVLRDEPGPANSSVADTSGRARARARPRHASPF